ncbi:hypothetical protein SK128_016970 [Halocaridina rubra]|uniref:SH2 domain-containing protein n=1 Tax=Halocaridina rubra TaxID=373956 RepID=A0AAN9AC16_HALRR
MHQILRKSYTLDIAINGRDNKTSVPNQQQSTGSRLPTSASAASSVSLNRQTTALSSSLSAIANKRALHSTKSNSPDRLQKPGSLNRLPTAQPQPLLPPTSRPPPPLPPVPHSLSHPSQPNPNIPPPDRAPPVPPTSRPPPPLPPVPHSLSHPSQPNPNIPPPDRAPPVPPLLGSLQNIGGGPPHGEIVRLGEGESVTLTPLYCALMDKPYFHLISRNKSKHLLEEAVEDGVFLIRPSTRSKDPLTLSLCYSRRIYNIVIRQRRDGLFALGSEKMNEVSFGTIDEVVSTHTSEPLKLQSGNRVTLTTSPPKTGHIYVTLPNTIEEKH